ncbi:MAG TPA: hypothetical protein VH814_02680 [Steroidobacteraceae bacterium]|jgi:hypothetical protein
MHKVLAMLMFVAVAANAAQPDEEFLGELIGTWDMSGELGGKPVHYRAQAVRTLAGGWIEFHMEDVATPRSYEARLFLSADRKAHDVIVHWLDQFGAAGARVVGTGTRSGNVLTVTFPYAEGAFRNEWAYDAAKHTWTLAIDAQESDKSWKPFARYTLQPAPAN